MMFNLVRKKIEKGDLVVCSEDTNKIIYVMGDEINDEFSRVYGIELTERHDDVIIVERDVRTNGLHLAKESTYNQIGYLMRLRSLVKRNQEFFSWPWEIKNNGDQ